MMKFPKIRAVEPLPGWRLLVTFENDAQKIYDCQPLLAEEVFQPLQNQAFFRAVHVDAGGYGISWNDEIDLSEAELWEGGTAVLSPDTLPVHP